MFGIVGKAISVAVKIPKLAKAIKRTARDGRELKDAIDEAIERTAFAAQDGVITNAEVQKVGQAWINVVKEGNDLWPILRRVWRLIS